MGVDATFVDPDCSEEELEAAFRENTKAVFGESIANPALVVLDFQKFASAAHRHGVPFIVDNTFATPINCRPFEWGADIVTHSTTNIWMAMRRVSEVRSLTVAILTGMPMQINFRDLRHRIRHITELYIQKIRKRRLYYKGNSSAYERPWFHSGAANAFLLNIGLETLHLRVPRHCENALKVAKYLKGHDKVAWVSYPSLEGDKYYDLAQKYMPNGTCGVLTFGLKGGREAAVE